MMPKTNFAWVSTSVNLAFNESKNEKYLLNTTFSYWHGVCNLLKFIG